MKLRFILIAILVILGGYYFLIEYKPNQEEKIIRENIAREVSLQAELSGRIEKAENTIKELTIAISGDKAKIQASVEVVNAYLSINSIKWYNNWGGMVVTTWQEEKWASDDSLQLLQAPSTGLFTCTVDWEVMLDDKVDELSKYEFIESCWSFEWISWCWLRTEDGANCFKK